MWPGARHFILGFVFLCAAVICAPVPSFGAEPVEIPITVAATGKILLDIRVNDKPVTCILDTGSPFFLLIDQVLVDQMGVEKSPAAIRLRFFAEDQGGDTYRATLDKVQIGPFEYRNVQAFTIDDIRRATGTGYQDLPNFWAQGILGIGFLQRYRAVIDYPHSRMLLYPPDDDTTVNNPPLVGLMIPTAKVTGPGDGVPFLIDTGSTFSVVSGDAMDQLGMSYLSMTGGDPLFKGVAKTGDITMDDVPFQDITLEVADHFSNYAGGSAFQGIIGYDYLQNLVLDLDFPDKKIGLEKP